MTVPLRQLPTATPSSPPATSTPGVGPGGIASMSNLGAERAANWPTGGTGHHEERSVGAERWVPLRAGPAVNESKTCSKWAAEREADPLRRRLPRVLPTGDIQFLDK